MEYRRACHSDTLVSSVMVTILAMAAIVAWVALASMPEPAKPGQRYALTRTVNGQVYVRDYNLTIDDCRTLQLSHAGTACALQH